MNCWSAFSRKARTHHITTATRRWLSAEALDKHLSQPVQSYISTSRDSFLNLSIEHHLFQKSAPNSVILFLYINRPSIIIGTNQNPWLETNLSALDQTTRPWEARRGPFKVDLVRRRSGGGTVFHDEGNVNWTVICPPADFTRDKHAEMVTRALRSCGIERARVNERHDIVLDQGEQRTDSDPVNTHVTPYTILDKKDWTTAGRKPSQEQRWDPERPRKVSGSAYKLTRNRALHHGTCLLSSPNLDLVDSYLRSPAAPYIEARSVASVPSPVTNIGLSNDEFIAAVQQHFNRQHAYKQPAETVGDELVTHPNIYAGYAELKDPEWTFLKTPEFTISSAADPDTELNMQITVKRGVITNAVVHSFGRQDKDHESPDQPEILGGRLHETRNWHREIGGLEGEQLRQVSDWLEAKLGYVPPHMRPDVYAIPDDAGALDWKIHPRVDE